MSFPIIFFCFLIEKIGIWSAVLDKLLIERFTPGAIIPPLYMPLFVTTSKVVAVPKSKTIQLDLYFLNTPAAFAIRSDPTCFLFFIFTFIILLIFFF
mgnify:CR=1 FL=1